VAFGLVGQRVGQQKHSEVARVSAHCNREHVCMNRRGRAKGTSGPLLPAPALAELATHEEPPVELGLFLKRLRAAGVVEVYVATQTPRGAFVHTSAEHARRQSSTIVARARRFVASQELNWTDSRPVGEALERLTMMVQRFDQLTRFWLAASDMRLAADTAAALVDAREHRGVARIFDRALETSLVVTFVRPYLESNEAGLGRAWWPTDQAARELFDELLELRHEYHAHAAHTPRRRLENTATLVGGEGRPRYAESWDRLPAFKLHAIEELANRQAARFDDQVEKLDVALFGPKE
jgi:hypothetical protein